MSSNDSIKNELGEWLEDKGQFSRFAINEESVWICGICGSDAVDPDEGACYACDVGAFESEHGEIE